MRLSCHETRKTPKEIRLGEDPFGLPLSPLSTQCARHPRQDAGRYNPCCLPRLQLSADAERLPKVIVPSPRDGSDGCTATFSNTRSFGRGRGRVSFRPRLSQNFVVSLHAQSGAKRRARKGKGLPKGKTVGFSLRRRLFWYFSLDEERKVHKNPLPKKRKTERPGKIPRCRYLS